MSVIPSFLASIPYDSAPAGHQLMDNIRLRVGEVKEILHPNHPRNHSGKFTEYTVAVQHYGNNVSNIVLYPECTVMNLFGGRSDMMVWTLRADTGYNPNDVVTHHTSGDGSKVLVACINGFKSQAVIIGGVNDFNDLREEGKKADALGHYFRMVFNGVTFGVNNAGEFELTYGGKTDNTGATAVSSDQTGTKIGITQNGNITIASPGGKQTVTINHAAGTIEISADKQYTVTADKVAVTADHVDISTPDAKIHGGKTVLGKGTDAAIRGTSYLAAEQQMFSALAPVLTALAGQYSMTAPPVSGALMRASASCARFASQLSSFLSRNHKLD